MTSLRVMSRPVAFAEGIVEVSAAPAGWRLYLGGNSKNSINGTIAFGNGRTICGELKPGRGTRIARGAGNREVDRERRGRSRSRSREARAIEKGVTGI